jgi:hypothetical protein
MRHHTNQLIILLLLCSVAFAQGGVVGKNGKIQGSGLVSPGSAQTAAGPTYVASTGVNHQCFTAATCATALGAATVQNDAIGVFISWPIGKYLTKITDNCGASGSDTYAIYGNPTLVINGALYAAVAWAPIGKSGSNTCTVTATFNSSLASGDVMNLQVFGVAKASGTPALENWSISANGNTLANYAAANAATSGAKTTTEPNEIVFGTFQSGTSILTFTAGTGFTAIVANAANLMVEDESVTATGSIAATSQNSTSANSSVVAGMMLTFF